MITTTILACAFALSLCVVCIILFRENQARQKSIDALADTVQRMAVWRDPSTGRITSKRRLLAKAVESDLRAKAAQQEAGQA